LFIFCVIIVKCLHFAGYTVLRILRQQTVIHHTSSLYAWWYLI